MRLKNRTLPAYSRGEETANMITHIAGAALAFTGLILCVISAAWNKNIPGIISGTIYGLSMIVVYVVSSVYHGLDEKSAFIGKRVMQVIDHCDIYGLIVGTFSPIVLCGLIKTHPVTAYVSYSIVWVTAIIGTVFTAIDFHKFRGISYSMYFISGWSVLITIKAMYDTFGMQFIILLVAGGAVYSLGMIFYALETKKHKYCHSVFHLFIIAGSVIQFIAVFRFCFLNR